MNAYSPERKSIHIPKRAVSINHRVIHNLHSRAAAAKNRGKSCLAGMGFYGLFSFL
jgi:hypothetical protein